MSVPRGAHYPIEWRRFRKRDTCPVQEFKDHTELCIGLIDDALKRGIPGDYTFDSYFLVPRCSTTFRASNVPMLAT